MTTRMLVLILGLNLLCMIAGALGLLPEAFGASAETIRHYRGLALETLLLGAPMLVAAVVSTWIWDVATGAGARRPAQDGIDLG